MIKKIFLLFIFFLYSFMSFSFTIYAKWDLFQSKDVSNYKNYFSENNLFYIDKKTGMSYLHVAAAFGNYKLVDFLLDKNLDYNLKDKFGYTPIDWALIGNRKKVLNIFKKKDIKILSRFEHLYDGVDEEIILPQYSYILINTILFDQEENNLERCYYISLMFRLDEFKDYLLKTYDINTDLNGFEEEYGMNALHQSVIWGDYLLTRYFVEQGVYYGKKDVNGKTPLDWANIKGNFAIIEYLMEVILDKEPWWKFW